MGDTVPEPDWVLEVRQWLQDRDNSHAAAVSAADNAALRKQVKMLREVVDGAAAVEEFGTTAQARERLGKMARKALAALEVANG